MDILYLFMAIIRYCIYALQICLLIRAFLSWFPGLADGALGDFVYTVTEPLVSFVGVIIDKIRPLREFPIDLSLFFACVLLNILLMFL